MLTCMKALLEAIVAEGPETGSRGGSIFIKDGEQIKENIRYRDYLTVTKDGKADFIKVTSVPSEQIPFEYYLTKIN